MQVRASTGHTEKNPKDTTAESNPFLHLTELVLPGSEPHQNRDFGPLIPGTPLNGDGNKHLLDIWMKAYVAEWAQNPVDGRLDFPRSFMLQLRAARAQEEGGGGGGEVP